MEEKKMEQKKTEQKRLSRMLLLAGALAGVGGLFILFVEAPAAAQECRAAYPEYAWLFWPGLLYVWAVGGLYLSALYQYGRICVRIGQDRSFCAENGKGLHRIARLLFAAAAACAAAPFLLAAAAEVGGPAVVLCLLLALASAAMGMLAWALGKLLMRAVALQEENDLTV